MALLTNYLVKKSTRTNMIAGTHHSGFEVIQDTESKKMGNCITEPIQL